MVVNVDKVGRSDEQILAAMRGDASVLGIEEMLYAATLTTDQNEKLKFYQTAASAFPKCIRAQNNIGCIQMALGKTDDAVAAFEKAKAMENNDVVKNNLGMGALAKGDLAKAEEYFTSMTAATAVEAEEYSQLALDVRAAQDGDRQAFGALIERYESTVYSIALRRFAS